MGFNVASFWRRSRLAILIVVLGGLAVAALIFFKPKPEPQPEPDPAPPLVDVIRIELESRALSVTTQGTVEPRREIQLVSQVAGTLVEEAPDYVSGGTFAEGDWLVQIDSRDYRFALINAEARLADAEQLLAVERGRARQAEREWRDLGNPDANALFLRKPQLAAAEAGAKAARADRDRAQLDLERTRVRAPFRGRIRDTGARLGQYVSPGTQIASIYDASTAQVRLPLSDADAALLDLPLGFEPDPSNFPQVTLRGTVAGESHVWTGHIARTQAALDPQSRMLHVVAEVPEPFNRDRHPAPLLIGLFVEAEIAGRFLEGVTVLPRSAVFQRDRIYTVSEEGEVVAKQVRVLQVEADRLWVKGDLRDGEAVVKDRQGYLRPGITVSIIGEQDDAEPEDEASDPEDSES